MTHAPVHPILAVVLGLFLPFLGAAQDAPATAATGPERGERPSYFIGREDVLQVIVFGEPGLSVAAVPVRPDGRISLPLIGDVLADGLTSEVLAAEIERRYEAHVVAPAVSVILVQVNSFKIFIVGSVQRPGVFTLGRQTTILQALALAGGFTDFANSKKMVVFREEEGGTRRMPINYELIVSGQDLGMNIRLKPGDTLVVR